MEEIHKTPIQDGPGSDDANLYAQGDGAGHGNLIIRGWHAVALALLKQYRDSLEGVSAEDGTLAEDFEFVSYPSIHKNLNLLDAMQVFEEGERVTIAINFQNRPRNVLRLYLCQIGAPHVSQSAYAVLQYQFGRQIAAMTEDVHCDVTAADSRFRAWFKEQMDQLFKDWLQDGV